MEQKDIIISLLWNLKTLSNLCFKLIEDSTNSKIEKTLKNSLIESLNLVSIVKNIMNSHNI